MDDPFRQSEIARLRQLLATECQAMMRELTGLITDTIGHDSIYTHMEQISYYQQQLTMYVSNLEAAHIVNATYAQVAERESRGGSVLIPVEDEPAGGIWMLTYEDGFCCSWFPFYAPSQEEAITYARQLIAQIPYEVINVKLYPYPDGPAVEWVIE